MVDTIGKCECINQSDKREIESVITSHIDELDNSLRRVRHDRQALIDFGANPDELTRVYDLQKSKLKNLLLRVRNTPGCE